MTYSPNTLYLRNIIDALIPLDIPVFQKLPDEEVPEPFFVIGEQFSSDVKTAKTGVAINDSEIRLHLFTSVDSRTELEELKAKTKAKLGRRQKINEETLIDDTLGRELYHVIFIISDIII